MSAMDKAEATQKRDLAMLRQLTERPEYWDLRVAPYLTESDSGCILWTGRVSPRGYGHVTILQEYAEGLNSRSVLVHRAALLRATGEAIDFGKVVDHLCHGWDDRCQGGNTCQHRRCVKTEHLSVTSIGENVMADGSKAIARVNAQKTHCSQGHLYDEENTDIWGGSRICRECRRQIARQKGRIFGEAARVLGITYREYLKQYGYTVATAQEIIANSTTKKGE